MDSPYMHSEPVLFHHKPVFSHPIHTHDYKEPGSVLSVLLIGAGAFCRVPPHPSHLQAEQVRLPQPLLTGHMLQHLTMVVALLNWLQFVNHFPVLGSQNGLLYLDVV